VVVDNFISNNPITNPNSSSVTKNDFGKLLDGTQFTVSEGHPISQIRKSGLKDIGGPFRSTRSYVATPATSANAKIETSVTGGKQVKIYSGPLLPFLPTSGGKLLAPPSAASTTAALEKLGATAIARCKPTNTPGDLATFVGETIKEGIPSLIGSSTWKDRTRLARGGGKEYLNAQFGWLPLVGEIKTFADNISKLDETMSQYERDAGRLVRRRYEFPIQKTVSERRIGAAGSSRAIYPNQQSEFISGPRGTVWCTTTTVHRRWFSGAFTYSLPTGYDSRSKLGRLRLMADRLGLDPSPDTVWNLAPWSWAADWFTNAGDVVSNLSDFASGGLVMVYGYMMEHSSVTDSYRLAHNTGLHPSMGKPQSLDVVTETKLRIRANPFGFGVSWDGLSPFQLSILAALGLSRT
jgi:hypothetical protein